MLVDKGRSSTGGHVGFVLVVTELWALIWSLTNDSLIGPVVVLGVSLFMPAAFLICVLIALPNPSTKLIASASLRNGHVQLATWKCIHTTTASLVADRLLQHPSVSSQSPGACVCKNRRRLCSQRP